MEGTMSMMTVAVKKCLHGAVVIWKANVSNRSRYGPPAPDSGDEAGQNVSTVRPLTHGTYLTSTGLRGCTTEVCRQSRQLDLVSTPYTSQRRHCQSMKATTIVAPRNIIMPCHESTVASQVCNTLAIQAGYRQVLHLCSGSGGHIASHDTDFPSDGDVHWQAMSAPVSI